jgi:hypothetical protein
MSSIEPLCVGAVESSESTTEIGLRGFQDQMIVIAHQAVDVTAPMLLLHFTAQESEKVAAVPIIQKNGLLRIASGGDVKECAGKFQAKRTSHEVGR